MTYLAIDFDGTIADHRYPGIGDAVPGAFHWMKKFQEAGAKLILYTVRRDGTRDGPVLTQAVDYCRSNGIEFYRTPTSSKPYADIYIDDAAFGCPLRDNPSGRPMVDWDVVGPKVMEALSK